MTEKYVPNFIAARHEKEAGAQRPKNLVRQEPNQPEETFPYEEGIIRRFKLDADEKELLESGQTLFRGDTAFSLED